METAGARVSCAMGLALLAFGCGYTRSRFRRLDGSSRIGLFMGVWVLTDGSDVYEVSKVLSFKISIKYKLGSGPGIADIDASCCFFILRCLPRLSFPFSTSPSSQPVSQPLQSYSELLLSDIVEELYKTLCPSSSIT